jgi:hypothetical protein
MGKKDIKMEKQKLILHGLVLAISQYDDDFVDLLNERDKKTLEKTLEEVENNKSELRGGYLRLIEETLRVVRTQEYLGNNKKEIGKKYFLMGQINKKIAEGLYDEMETADTKN